MKRFSSSDSLAAILSISSAKEEKTQKTNQGYSREFQAMLDSFEEEDYSEEAANTTEKKRRLTLEQVKALEKNFEVENKLEPERKLRLAEELGLQPRQVAIWFQNRRARWKTKQLERDYGTLKANYEALKLDYSSLEQENEALTIQLKELKGKVNEEKTDSTRSIKEEYPVSESENNVSGESQSHDFSDNNNSNGTIKDHTNLSPTHALTDWIHLSEPGTIFGNNGYHHHHQACQPHSIKLEEQNVFSTEGSCNFFSVDQPPTLHWYCPEQ